SRSLEDPDPRKPLSKQDPDREARRAVDLHHSPDHPAVKQVRDMKNTLSLSIAILAAAFVCASCTNKQGETESPVFITVNVVLQPGFVNVGVVAPVQIATTTLASQLTTPTQTDPQRLASTSISSSTRHGLSAARPERGRCRASAFPGHRGGAEEFHSIRGGSSCAASPTFFSA